MWVLSYDITIATPLWARWRLKFQKTMKKISKLRLTWFVRKMFPFDVVIMSLLESNQAQNHEAVNWYTAKLEIFIAQTSIKLWIGWRSLSESTTKYALMCRHIHKI